MNINTLYIYRQLSWDTAEAIRQWAHEQGIKTTLPCHDMHVTVVYSQAPVLWDHEDEDREELLIVGGQRSIRRFGEDGNCIVLALESEELTERHHEIIDERGASNNHDGYTPHITITYKGQGVDVNQISPYSGNIKLTGEIWQPVEGNPYSKDHEMSLAPFRSIGEAQVLKVHPKHGLVVGYAIVSKVEGEDYYDLHGDHIPEDSMLKASIEFMSKSRISGNMHSRDKSGNPIQDGEVVFAFPMTTDIAESLGISVEKTGLLVGMKPSAEVLMKFQSGEYTGFSIGGRRIVDEEMSDG